MDMDALTHVVQKPFYDGEFRRIRNECVDAGGWANTQKLADNGFLIVLAPNIQPVEDSEGRFWLPGRMPPGRTPKEGEATTEAPSGDGWPQKQKGNWWLLSDGNKVQGEAKARKAQADLMQPV